MVASHRFRRDDGGRSIEVTWRWCEHEEGGIQVAATAQRGGWLRKGSRFRRRLKRLLGLGLCALGALVVFTVVYLAAALILGFVPVNEDFRNAEHGIEVYLVSNGVHVDFVLPARSRAVDWTEHFPREEFEGVDRAYEYLVFGWGERSFYIETPTWDGVKAWTVVRAMIWPTRSAMHVQYERRRPITGESARRVVLTGSQYETLTDLLLESFDRTAGGGVRLIPGRGYGPTDNFYEGAGTYHLFNTCNMWTNRLLKKTGVTTAVWSPFTGAILDHLEPGDGSQ